MSFNWFWLLGNLKLRYVLMTLSIKNGGYAFLIRLNLILSMSFWKEFKPSQILNDYFKQLLPILYFSIQPDKIKKSKIFNTFEKIQRLFFNILTSKEAKSQIKVNLSYPSNSYVYNYKHRHAYYVSIAFYETSKKIKISL